MKQFIIIHFLFSGTLTLLFGALLKIYHKEGSSFALIVGIIQYIVFLILVYKKNKNQMNHS